MPLVLSYSADSFCDGSPPHHGTLHVFKNAVEQFSQRIDYEQSFPPLTNKEQKEFALLALRYAMQVQGYTPSGMQNLSNALTGKGVVLDLVTVP